MKYQIVTKRDGEEIYRSDTVDTRKVVNAGTEYEIIQECDGILHDDLVGRLPIDLTFGDVITIEKVSK